MRKHRKTDEEARQQTLKSLDQKRAVYWERVKNGLCITCGATAEPGVRHCERCRIRANLYQHDRYVANRAIGACIRCGKPSRPNRVTCEACAEAASRNYFRRKRQSAEGLVNGL